MTNKQLKFSLIIFISLFIIFDINSHKIVVSSPIEEKAFVDRVDIDEVVFEDDCGIIEIPDYAFLGCTSLRKVRLPEGLKKIGFQAFSECSSLEYINFPNSLEDIGSNSFTYCELLNNLQFPNGLIHIGHNAFSFCNSLEKVFLPDSLQEIESYAFSDCNSLQKVRFPANDKMLGELILNCCPSVIKIIEPSLIPPTFDCDSFIFDPLDISAYQHCSLMVQKSSIPYYQNSPSWSLFENICAFCE